MKNRLLHLNRDRLDLDWIGPNICKKCTLKDSSLFFTVQP